MSDVRILTIDIETSPNVAEVWGLWNQNIGIKQLRESTEMICFAAKWHGEKRVEFRSNHHDGHQAMVERAHQLLDEASIVVHFNGKTFDVPHMRREFLLAGLPPTSPFFEVDLMQVARKSFRFTSNKLDYIGQYLGIGKKTQHDGHELWHRCIVDNDPKAWALMRRYNVQDVRLTEELYDRLRPWVSGHPHLGLLSGAEGDVCSRCGSDDLQRRGYAYTPLSAFQQYRCNQCGAWSRGKKAIRRVDARGVAS